MKKNRLSLFCFICLVPVSVFGNVIRVPERYSTIHLVINATQSGDTVPVDDGYFYSRSPEMNRPLESFFNPGGRQGD